MNTTSLYERIGGKTAIHSIVETFYNKVQDDYRLNRFFNSTEQSEQIEALTALAIALCDGSSHNTEEFTALLNNFFIAAFARGKRTSFIAGSDFGFFGMVIAQDHPSNRFLSDGHRFLLKFMPDDFHYDAVIELLAATLRQLNFDSALVNEIVAWAEQGRNSVLGK
jgi:hemoglobin